MSPKRSRIPTAARCDAGRTEATSGPRSTSRSTRTERVDQNGDQAPLKRGLTSRKARLAGNGLAWLGWACHVGLNCRGRPARTRERRAGGRTGPGGCRRGHRSQLTELGWWSAWRCDAGRGGDGRRHGAGDRGRGGAGDRGALGELGMVRVRASSGAQSIAPRSGGSAGGARGPAAGATRASTPATRGGGRTWCGGRGGRRCRRASYAHRCSAGLRGAGDVRIRAGAAAVRQRGVMRRYAARRDAPTFPTRLAAALRAVACGQIWGA